MKDVLVNYKNLVFAIELFDISWLEDLGVDGNRNSLKRLINEGIINGDNLINEYNKAINSKNFDWKKIADDLNLFYKSDLELYSTSELQEIIGFYLFPFIHKEFSDTDFKRLEEVINVELDSINDQEDWISKEYLDKRIKEKIESYKPYFLIELLDRSIGKYELENDHVNKWPCFNKIRNKN